ncbi:MAG TPA: secretin N-terminal domain-containing protein, partial [Burkholderiales bacterium]|nr:secretin N-terminal domain-containing protein [Burkholderiales bacterium]
MRLFALLLLLWITPVQAQSDDTVTLNFVNADIEGVVKAVSDITGKNFVVDPRVKGTVNIVSARPVARDLVYEIFLSALRLQGYAAVEERGLVKILPEGDAKLYPGRGQVQTRVFTLKHESAAQLVPILRPLIPPANTITAYAGNNTLVITDYVANLQRLARIIDSLDQPGGSDPVVIPLAHASALDVAQTVNRLFAETAPDSGQRLIVVADARSNSLVARSDNASRMARLHKIVAMLDSPTSAAGNLHVVYLKNAEAVKVAETLRAIYLGDAAPATLLKPVAAPMAAAPAAGALPAAAAFPAPQVA